MKFNPRIVYFFLAASIAVAAFAGFSYKTDIESGRDYYDFNQLVNQHIENISGSVLQMESGYRGYIITGFPSFKKSFLLTADQVIGQLDTLRNLTSGDITQQKNIDTLSGLVQEKISFGTRLVDLRDSSIQDAISFSLSGSEVRLMDSIKDRIGLMLHEQDELLKLRITAHKKSERDSYVIGGCSRICVIILFVLLLFRLNKDMRLRKKAESEAKINEEKYKRLIEDAHVVMFSSDINGLFTFISDRVLLLTGYAKEELLGKSFEALVKDDWIEKVRDHYSEQIKQRAPETSLEFPIFTKERDIKWVEQMGVIRYDEYGKLAGMQFIVKDITDQKRTQSELERSEMERKEYQQRLQSILDNSTALVYMKDTQGRYLFVNKKFESVFQVTLVTLRGKTDFELHPDESAKRYTLADKWVLENKKPKEVQEVISQPDGDHHYVIVKFPLYNIYHEVEGVCGIATDITTRVQYEQELIEARKVAEQAEKFQEQFLANMSHDIRTPLNGIVGMTNLLSGTNLNGEQKEFIDAIRQSSDTLMVLVNDILDLSKIKAGRLGIESIPFDIRELVARSVCTLKRKAKEKSLQFIISIGPDIPVTVTGDPHRLSQILINLISNSVKFTDQGEVMLSLRVSEREADKVQICFSVKDTGIGIAKDKLDMIFESFTQSNSDTSRKYGGTGLGLAIVKQLVLLQDGEIHVESGLGKGSNFQFTIPYFIPSDSDPDFIKPEDPGTHIDARDLSNYCLLVAEDDRVNQKVIQYTLKRAGVCTDIVENGKEMIALLQAGKKYDLILSDIHMPEMDGYEAAKYIRHVLKIGTPILAMTATVLKEEKNLCLEAGMNDYITKPFSIDELIEKISYYVKNEKGTHSLNETEVNKPSAGKLFDLSYLKELDDPLYLKDVLTIFLNDIPKALHEIKENTPLQQWAEVNIQAHKMKSSLGMLQINDLLDAITTIERNAKAGTNLDAMQGFVERALILFDKVQPLLEEERNKL
jgi:PAS domain S-box-containing protein